MSQWNFVSLAFSSFVTLFIYLFILIMLMAYILLLRFLHKKGLSIVTKLHMQVYRLSIHFDVDLERRHIIPFQTCAPLLLVWHLLNNLSLLSEWASCSLSYKSHK